MDMVIFLVFSGKTKFIEKLLVHLHVIFKKPPGRVLLLYRRKQPIYQEWLNKFSFLSAAEGINVKAVEKEKEHPGKSGTLLIMDGKKVLCIINLIISHFRPNGGSNYRSVCQPIINQWKTP